MFKNIAIDIKYASRGFTASLNVKDSVISWQDVMDKGFSVGITAENETFFAYLYISVENRGNAVLKCNEEIVAVLAPDEEYMCVNRNMKECELYIETDFKDVKINSIEAFSYAHKIFPEPLEYEEKDGEFVLADGVGVAFEKCFLKASELIKEELCIDDGDGILLVKDGGMEEEEFLIEITKTQITASAGGVKGAVYAADVIIQLLSAKRASCALIHDKPFMKLRGFHGGLPSAENIEFYKKFIRYVLVPMRYNVLFIQPTSAMKYDTLPEINESWLAVCDKYRKGVGEKPFHYDMLASGGVLEKEQVREIIAYARAFGIEVIPEIQALGHVQYMTRAFPGIGETLEQSFSNNEINVNDTDERPESDISHCYCPQNPKSYEILFSIIDEVIEVFGDTEYIHMGHDEVYEIGVCEKCRSIPPDRLFYDDVMRIYNYLAKKGKKMMIWSDMLQSASDYKTVPALKKLPKDIILMDFIWYFHLDKNIEESLICEGFKVVMGNMNSSHYPRFEERRDKVIGAETSTWVEISEKSFALEGKFFEAVYSGNMMWQKAYKSELRECYSYIIAEKLKSARRCINNDREEYTKKAVELPGSINTPYTGYICNMTGYGKAVDASCEITVDEYADKILFVHTADKREKRIAWENLVKTGSYEILYEDGESVTVPIEYDGNIRVWNEKYASAKSQPYYRHEGYVGTYECYPVKTGVTYSLTPYTVYGYEWYNPFKNKKIKCIKKDGALNSDVRTLLFDIQLMRKK